MRSRLSLLAKKALTPLLYRHRPVGISAGKLYLYLDALYRTNQLPGAVVEIGCNVGGTASLGNQMLRKLRSERRYLCIDTFAGFVEEQFEDDVRRGNPGDKPAAFSANDIGLARRVLDRHGGREVELLQADICELPAEQLPASVSVCLIDVDLYQPVYASLEKMVPRMEIGGRILVDDCSPPGEANWQAGAAVRDFAERHGHSPAVEFGMAVLVKH